MSSIRFSHVSKTFLSGSEAVKNFNLEMEDGEFVVLFGPSGCGKSTLLRLVAGLETISSGELYFGDRLVNDLDPGKRNVAMVFQNYALFPNLSVADNIGFALKIKKEPKAEIRRKVEEIAKTLDITELLDRKAKKLSGGQSQRIAIGRALVSDPDIFLLDEPLSNLDMAMRNELRKEIARLQKELGITTIYVTHDQTEAMTLADRIVVMNEGEIQQVDSPQNLIMKPANLFVARFFGGTSMNIFSAVYRENGSEPLLETGSFALRLPDWKAKILSLEGYDGKNVSAAIRSSDIYSGDDIPEDKTGVQLVNAEVDSIDVLGAEENLHFSCGESGFFARSRVRADIKVSDEIQFGFDTEYIHVFDAESGLSITH